MSNLEAIWFIFCSFLGLVFVFPSCLFVLYFCGCCSFCSCLCGCCFLCVAAGVVVIIVVVLLLLFFLLLFSCCCCFLVVVVFLLLLLFSCCCFSCCFHVVVIVLICPRTPSQNRVLKTLFLHGLLPFSLPPSFSSYCFFPSFLFSLPLASISKKQKKKGTTGKTDMKREIRG